MGLADRIVVGVTLRARAEALAAAEGLVADAPDLARDAREFAAVVRAQNPLGAVFTGVGVAAGVLGFFGMWSVQVLRGVLAPEAVGVAETTIALIGVLTVAAAAVIVAVVRAAVEAARAAVEDVDAAVAHPSAVLLREVRPAEERLFAVLRLPLPEPAISAGPLIALAGIGLAAGVACAALTGVGIA
ncbi:hypothetical protein HPO96_22535 [Kribbella sandramycini]|uniref:Uncharacterized protein n=1 Tax=Kribbella sandramycini TaxID=60450 RepID=A0A7Y4L2C4_9ACTN|nr:hypothetical protein [Kribbella sandramycini]MBB6566309.1 hypothetical protein [Kribbella sandramycini]NOL43028.1 hypothetical protein [Kribbella sandramycini]